MRKTEAPKVDVRQEFIEKGIIVPFAVPTESVNCNKCDTPFDRIFGNTADRTCGQCAFRRNKGNEQ